MFARAEVRRHVNPTSSEQIKDDFMKLLDRDSTTREEAQQGLDLLKYWDIPIADYVAAAHKRWSQATAFACGA